MNHLAHLFLSQTDVDLFVGNFIADSIKGKQYLKYTQGIQEGILMHRSIDTFTDTHPIVLESKKRLYPKYSHYAGILIDIYYDHILAKNWKEYSPIALESFATSAYKILNAHKDMMPELPKEILYYMELGDWLSSYAKIEGINKTFQGMHARIQPKYSIQNAADDLTKDFALFEDEFNDFFPLLVEHCRNWTDL